MMVAAKAIEAVRREVMLDKGMRRHHPAKKRDD